MKVKQRIDRKWSGQRLWKSGKSSRKKEAVITISVTSLYLPVSKRSNSNLHEYKWVVGQWTYLIGVFDLKCLVFLILKMREFDKLLMKESYNIQQFNIYWILENFLEKIFHRKLYALNFKWLLWDFSLRAWASGQVKIQRYASKICLTKGYLVTSST